MLWHASAIVAVALFASQSGHAWYKHSYLMPGVLEGLNDSTQAKLGRAYHPPCLEQDHAIFMKLAAELQLNPAATLAATSGKGCGAEITQGALRVRATVTMTAKDVLLAGFVDDPDGGMDRDLDLSPDQRFMGGKAGPTSQGYRHMYFGGWKLTSPLTTFQIPPHAMGQAPERAQVLAEKARTLFQAGDPIWGARVLSWALHFVQDLSQPFHAVQIPNLMMVPWTSLAGALFADTERSITNYHWAYEGYVLNRLEQGQAHRFADCLRKPDALTTLELDTGVDPRGISHAVAAASIGLANRVGAACVHSFGTALKTRDCDLPKNRCTPKYDDVVGSELDDVTCMALANASSASRQLINWVLSGF